jgi:hypothetical protein
VPPTRTGMTCWSYHRCVAFKAAGSDVGWSREGQSSAVDDHVLRSPCLRALTGRERTLRPRIDSLGQITRSGVVSQTN